MNWTDEEAEKENVKMEKDLWSDLPEHLVELVLSFLPAISILRFRFVCKRWNELVHDQNFVRLCSRVPSKSPVILLNPFRIHQVLDAFDLASNSWNRLQLGSLLPEYDGSKVVVATAGGLVCLAMKVNDSYRTLFVCNPVTKAFRELPPIGQTGMVYVVGMFKTEARGYKILAADNGVDFKVYDSRSNSWQVTGSLHSKMAIVDGALYREGFYYCLGYGVQGTIVLAYHVNEGLWHQLYVELPFGLVTPQVFENRGQLMVIGWRDECPRTSSIHIWKFDVARPDLEEVWRIPFSMIKELTGTACSQDLKIFAYGPDVFFILNRRRDAFVYNLNSHSWRRLAEGTGDKNVWGGSCSALALQLRLDAEV